MKTVMDAVYDAANEHSNKDWPPVKAAKFLSWFQRKIDLIPEQYRSTARVQLSAELDIDSDNSFVANIRIDYERPATEADIQTNTAWWKNHYAERERSLLEELNNVRTQMSRCGSSI